MYTGMYTAGCVYKPLPRMPRTVSPLNNTQLLAAKPKAARYSLHDGGGLLFEVHPSGAKTWLLRFRAAGKESRVALVSEAGVSSYPAVGLAEARRLARVLRERVAQSGSPVLPKVELAVSVRDAANMWYAEKKERWAATTATKVRAVLNNYVLEAIGDIPIASLSTAQVAAFLRPLGKKTPGIGLKAKMACEQIVSYAIQRGLREDGRMLSLQDVVVAQYTKNQPAITGEPAMRQLLAALYGLRSYRIQSALLLALWTAARPGNVVSASWAEIDLEHGEWSIPAEKMKMRKAFVLPLSTQAVERLRAIKQLSDGVGFVFPGDYGVPHIHRDTLSRHLLEQGMRGLMVPHGFRATFRTMGFERLGIDESVLEAQLAHANGTYNRAKLLKQRREAMQQWADYLDTLRDYPEPSAELGLP